MTRPAGSWQERWWRRFYLDRPGWLDGTTRFHALITQHVERREPRARILEIGPGPDNPTSRHLASLGELHGIDPDPAIRDNAALTSAHVLDETGRYPFDDDAFDACVSDYVLEHVAEPLLHLREVERVLAPGGVYVFRTPNRWHPISLVAAATPHWFHEQVANRLRGLPGDAHDPYPTVYRLNSRRAITRAAAQAGLAVSELQLIEPDPSYGASSRGLFLAFMAYERVVNSTALLAGMRVNILGVLHKPSSA